MAPRISGSEAPWRRDAVEFGALFVAAGLAHIIAAELGYQESGSVTLIGLGAALCLVVGAHLWWSHRREHRSQVPEHRGEGPPGLLWRVRAQVRETPGQLAALAAAIAATGGN